MSEDTFTLSILLGSEAMADASDVAEALEHVAGQLRAGKTTGKILDWNGNIRGSFELPEL